MWVRTTTAQLEPGQIDEFVKRWQEVVAPHVPEMPGLAHVYLCGNRETNTVMTIHLWETPPDQVAHAIHDRQHFREHVRNLLVADPVVAAYELLVQSDGATTHQ